MRTLLLTALLATTLPSFAQSSLMVDWEWKRAHQCSSTSPSIEISGIPAEAKSLAIKLVDHDAPDFEHGGGVVAHDGRQQVLIPEGALKNYKGPCPPNFDSFGHDYAFVVRAMAADGKTELAQGESTKTFSANTVKQ